MLKYEENKKAQFKCNNSKAPLFISDLIIKCKPKNYTI